MKRCPECMRDYHDDSLLYCLEDGSVLVQGSVTLPHEPQTAILHEDAGLTRQQSFRSNGSLSETKRDRGRRLPIIIGAFGLIFALVAGVFVFYSFKSDGSVPRSIHADRFERMKITKLTDSGKTGRVAISPDGKYVVHTVEDGETQSLWVRHVNTGSNVQIIPPAAISYGRLAMSPDGDHIYFGRFDKTMAAGAHPLYRVPVLGGDIVKVMDNASSSITFAPDGKRFAFVRTNLAHGETSVVVVNDDGSNERIIATRKQPEVFRWNGPSWSPDGNLIAVPSIGYDNGTFQYIGLVHVADGKVEPLGTRRWQDIGRLGWIADGSGMVASFEEPHTGLSQYYLVSYPEGEARRITNDFNDYHDLGLTSDSSAFVTVREERVIDIWTASGGDVTKLRQITRVSERYDGDRGVQWMPDGRIVFESVVNGISNIAVINGDGTGLKQLTSKDDNESPAVSPDGRYIVYLSYRNETGLWRMNPDGSEPVQLDTVGGGSVHNLSASPSFTPDSRWVVYYSRGVGRNGVWKLPVEGGIPVQISDKDGSQPVVSPDGKLIASFYRDSPGMPYRVAIIPFDGGDPIRALDIPIAVGSSPSLGLRQVLRWLPDSRSIAYMDIKEGVSNIWAQPIDGGPPKQLTNFTSGEIFWFDLDREGKPSLFSRGSVTKDVVLVSNYR